MHEAKAQSRQGKQIPVDLDTPLSLTIHYPSANVSVRAVARPDVLVGFGSPGFPEELGDDESGLIIDARGNHIEIRPNPHLNAGWSGFMGDIDLEAVIGQIASAFRGGSFFSAKPASEHFGSGSRPWPDLAVEVPQSITGQVEIHSASGDALVEGVSGEIAIKTMSGDLRIVRTIGPLTVQTASGDLLVEDASGKLTMHAASGDTRVTSSRIDGFDIQTASGDVHLDATLIGDGPFRAQTANGDIHLLLRRPAAAGEEPAAALAFHTVSGDAHVSPPFRKTDRRRWQSGSGDRGPRIDITTVNGDLTAAIAATIAASDERTFVPAPSPAVFVEDAPPAAPAPEDRTQGEHQHAGTSASPEVRSATTHDITKRLAVLEAVERGEIDIEEALRRLDAEDAVAKP